MTFADALFQTRRALDDAGFQGARVAVLLTKEQVARAQREPEVAKEMIHEAFRPSLDQHGEGVRIVAVVHGVDVVVEG